MSFYAGCFYLAVALGRPFGGLRPHRIYNWLARRAFTCPEFRWYRDKWGCQLYLSPFYALDREIIAFGTYEVGVHEFLKKFLRPGMVVLDLGANIGSMTLHMARCVSPDGKVLAFEPAPTVLKRLRQNVEKNADIRDVITIFPLALSAANEQVAFAIADEATENQGMGSIFNRKNEVVSREINVETRTLDNLAAELNLSRCDLIKVDIQGAEMAFLAGAREFLKKYRPSILMEVSAEDLSCSKNTPRDLFERLAELKYNVFELENGRRGRQISVHDFGAIAYQDAVLCCPMD